VKVLITGATGFIGSRFAEICKGRGYDVVALGQENNDVERERKANLRRVGVAVEQLDLGSDAALGSQLSGVDVVFHLAAAQHEMNRPDSYFWAINVEGTRRMLDASIAAGVKRFVYGSTIGVYGVPKVDVIDETTSLDPDNIYGVTKRAAEQLVLEYGSRLPVSVVRISETYGPGDRRLLKLFRSIKAGKFFLIGKCGNIHQPIYVDDLAEVLLLAAESEAALGEVFVAPGPDALTTEQMCRGIATALDTTLPRLRVPMFPMLLASIVLERTLRPLGIQPPLHTRRLDFFRKSLAFTDRKLRAVLGYRPAMTFAQGARETARWYSAQGLL
jgi:nucleoside-diphosphate-sugar epimerase